MISYVQTLTPCAKSLPPSSPCAIWHTDHLNLTNSIINRAPNRWVALTMDEKQTSITMDYLASGAQINNQHCRGLPNTWLPKQRWRIDVHATYSDDADGNNLSTFLEKVIITQIVGKYPAFYGTRRIIAAFSYRTEWLNVFLLTLSKTEREDLWCLQSKNCSIFTSSIWRFVWNCC